MPAQIVVVERPRSGIVGRLRGARAWLRAFLQRDAPAPARRAAASRTRPFDSAADAAGTSALPEAESAAPADAVRLEAAVLTEVFAKQGATVVRSRDGMLRLELDGGAAAGVLRRLRDEPPLGFDRLLDLSVIDQIDRTGRLEVVYLCEASAHGERMRVHVSLASDAPETESVAALWPAADWLEREAFDLFGVRFRGHPGLQRLLLPADFEGAPLRRDFVATSMASAEAPK
jgi:NADH:ubiquinone oxidoreductase subunit C